MSNLVLEATQLSKTYHEGIIQTSVFSDIDFSLYAGEKIAIIGASGSGKSTLLHVLAGLDTPDSGVVRLNSAPFSTEGEAKRGRLRNQHMGFVYQFHHLLPELTALENVMMPLRIRRTDSAIACIKAQTLLKRVGLAARMEHKPSELSGGERQRVAIARALITEPKCILADEPTGNLDHSAANQVFNLLLELNQELQTAILIVTHDLELAAKMDRQLTLLDGQLVE
ncbi:lipoprotein-releasing ABC transporter ATP-binding protein LolD [Thiomicrorhabdus arctica]|uniref:lipoprotein-releasing ABC transporter ATP-binding protein LolD n=1 Tax=Thiomicrorhabdus arctica TaxID=131540 RepID=UPI000374C92F|nr:lipoprotein-releasing ABC transporter ATP-binding protein LolD [Thiomicrorhabdus arctica]